VSRLWAERRRVALEPQPAELGEAEPWRGALERLRRDAAAWRGRIEVTVVLSNHFVRYAVLPAQQAATPDEELALARFQFARIHGERAKSWEVRVSEGLGCAIDAALLAEIRAIFKKDVKLVSVQPYLMAAYNRSRTRIPREGAWLVLAEPERVCLARLAGRGWASVYNGRETDTDALIERERNRAGGETLPSLVLQL